MAFLLMLGKKIMQTLPRSHAINVFSFQTFSVRRSSTHQQKRMQIPKYATEKCQILFFIISIVETIDLKHYIT